MHYVQMMGEPPGLFEEVVGLILKYGWKDSHPCPGKTVVEEVQGVYTDVSRSVTGYYSFEVMEAVGDKAMMVIHLYREFGWIEGKHGVAEGVVAAAARWIDKMLVIPGCHIQDNIVEMAAGMLPGHMVDGAEREQSRCQWRYEGSAVSVGSHIAADCIWAGHARDLEQRLGFDIRYQ